MQADRRTGMVLVVAAAIAWSTAPFFTRLLHYDSWTIIFWRGLFGGSFVALLDEAPQQLPIGRTAIAVSKGGSAKEINHLVDLALHRILSRRRLSFLPSTNPVPARGRFDALFSR